MARKTETLIRLTAETKKKLETLATERVLSQSQMVEELIKQEAMRRGV